MMKNIVCKYNSTTRWLVYLDIYTSNKIYKGKPSKHVSTFGKKWCRRFQSAFSPRNSHHLELNADSSLMIFTSQNLGIKAGLKTFTSIG